MSLMNICAFEIHYCFMLNVVVVENLRMTVMIMQELDCHLSVAQSTDDHARVGLSLVSGSEYSGFATVDSRHPINMTNPFDCQGDSIDLKDPVGPVPRKIQRQL